MATPDPYNPNVPQFPGNSLASSQPKILDNFIQMYNKFLVNHVELNAGSTAGNHTIVQLLEQDSGPETNLGELSIYTKDVPGQTDQLFLRRQNNGPEIQLTNYQIYVSGTTNFFTFLPGKFIVYFGSFTTLENNKLKLQPAVAKNITSVSSCPLGVAPKYKCNVSLESINGLFTGVIFQSSIFNTGPPPSYYLIVGNL